MTEQVGPISVSGETDNSTIWSIATPPETVASENTDKEKTAPSNAIESDAPWPGSTYIISSTSTNQVLTLRNGEVILAAPGGRGSIHWDCVEVNGWLGFRNSVSGCLLTYFPHNKNKIGCSVKKLADWEKIALRPKPGGGYVLMMTFWEGLRPIGTVIENGKTKLAKLDNDPEAQAGLVLRFIKV